MITSEIQAEIQAQRASTLLVIHASRRGLVAEAVNNPADTLLLDALLDASWAITGRGHHGVQHSPTKAVLYDYPTDEHHQFGLGAALIGTGGYADVICEFEQKASA